MEPEIKKVLVPIDFSDYSKSSLRYAVNFAKKFNAEIYLIYVVEPVIYPPDFSMGQIAIPSVNNKFQQQRRQSEGDEFDLDAITDLFVDVNSRHTPSDKIYLSRRRKEKDLSIF